MQLRARTIETIGYMIEAVAEEKAAFKSSVDQIASSLIALLGQVAHSTDDPQVLAIKETLSKISLFLKEDFHPYMQAILPTLISDTKLEIDIKLTSADDIEGQDSKSAGVTLKLKGFEGDQKISMNTSALEAKVMAFKLINSISEHLGTSQTGFSEVVLPVMLQHLTYNFSKAIRKYAMKTCVNIVHVVGPQYNVSLFQAILQPFVEIIKSGIENQDLKNLKMTLKHLWLMIKTLNEDEKQTKNYLNEQQLGMLGPLLNKVLNIVSKAKTETTKSLQVSKKNFDMDEEDLDRVKEELAKICGASTYVMEISGQLVVNFGQAVSQIVKANFLNYFALNLNAYKDLSESELLDATCFFCDFIEYSYHSQDAIPMIVELNSKFIEIFNSSEEIATIDVKQTLSYGMGVFAMHITPTIYSAIVPQTLAALNSMISAPEAFSQDNVVSTESALGALGKVVYFQRQASPALITD